MGDRSEVVEDDGRGTLKVDRELIDDPHGGPGRDAFREFRLVAGCLIHGTSESDHVVSTKQELHRSRGARGCGLRIGPVIEIMPWPGMHASEALVREALVTAGERDEEAAVDAPVTFERTRLYWFHRPISGDLANCPIEILYTNVLSSSASPKANRKVGGFVASQRARRHRESRP